MKRRRNFFYGKKCVIPLSNYSRPQKMMENVLNPFNEATLAILAKTYVGCTKTKTETKQNTTLG